MGCREHLRAGSGDGPDRNDGQDGAELAGVLPAGAAPRVRHGSRRRGGGRRGVPVAEEQLERVLAGGDGGVEVVDLAQPAGRESAPTPPKSGGLCLGAHPDACPQHLDVQGLLNQNHEFRQCRPLKLEAGGVHPIASSAV